MDGSFDADELRDFLQDVDLTLAGLGEPTVQIWIERDELEAALSRAHQMRLFTASGQLDREVAWSLPLADGVPAHRPL